MFKFEMLVAAAYAVTSAIWIAGSDHAVALLFPNHITEAQTLKGWLFVAVTAVLLYATLRRYRLFRQQIETTLQASEERLALALDAADAGAWDRDLGTGASLWSAGNFRLLGLDHTSVKPSYEMFLHQVHPDDRTGLDATIKRAIALGGQFETCVRILRPDGTARHLSIQGRTNMDANGKPVRLIGLNIDITERVRVMKELEVAKQAAENATIAKSKFLAAASHDLRQPVQSLLLFCAILRERFGTASHDDAMDGMNRSIDALRYLLDSLLDMSKLDAGLVTPQVAEVPLGPLLAGLKAEYGPRAAECGLQLRVAPCSAIVRTDPRLLERMVRNLIENALRYTPRGKILVGCRGRKEHLRLEVMDSGMGIAPEDQEHVFDEFFQIDNPERDRGKGLGLGLAIVRRLAQLLRHPVGLTSVQGRGSCFSIKMPLAGRALTPKAQAMSAMRPGRGKIVVIDDEELIRQAMQSLLEEWGYEVLAAESGNDALEKLRQSDRIPALVIADYRLRHGEVGTDAIIAIHEHYGRRIPGVIVTGDTAPERLKEAVASGASLLHKPIAAEALRTAVAALTAEV